MKGGTEYWDLLHHFVFLRISFSFSHRFRDLVFETGKLHGDGYGW